MQKTKIRLVMFLPFTGRPARSYDGRHLDDILDDRGILNQRLRFMMNQIEFTANHLTINYKDDVPGTLRLFMAPEWYVRPKTYAYTQDEMFAVINQLLSMSKRPDIGSMLIIPGSIYWGENTFDTTPAGKRIIRTYNCLPIIKNGSLLCMIHKRVNSDIDPDRKLYEKWGTENELGEYVEEELIDINRMIEQRFPGTSTTGFFSVDSLDFGIEHGEDHLSKRLLQLHNDRGFNYVDVHLVLSMGTQILSGAVVAKEGGYVAQCDGSFSDDVTRLSVGSNLFKVFYRSNQSLTIMDITAPSEIRKVFFSKEWRHYQGDPTHLMIVYNQLLTFRTNQSLNQTLGRFAAAIQRE